jgi:hypothetical protein
MTKNSGLSFFDPEHVERPVPARPWRAILAGALAATALGVFGWELYWRANWYEPGDFNNSFGLWARQRDRAVGDATVFIGSSRILFDVDLDVWEELAGVRPVQLATEGTSPRLFLEDLASDPKFNGLVVVGVTAPLFFSMKGGLREDLLADYRKETPSDRLDYFLASRLEETFAYTDDFTRPKMLIKIAPLPTREGMPPNVVIRKLSTATVDRNTRMWRRVEEDPGFRQLAKDNWVALIKQLSPPPGPDGAPPPPMPDAAIDAVIDEVKTNIDKIRARGGDVAFLRFPYGGVWEQTEDLGFPRARFWDRLVTETGSVGVAWQDYPALQGFDLPEWSHLSAAESERYTRALVPIFYEELRAAGAGRRAVASP